MLLGQYYKLQLPPESKINIQGTADSDMFILNLDIYLFKCSEKHRIINHLFFPESCMTKI